MRLDRSRLLDIAKRLADPDATTCDAAPSFPDHQLDAAGRGHPGETNVVRAGNQG